MINRIFLYLKIEFSQKWKTLLTNGGISGKMWLGKLRQQNAGNVREIDEKVYTSGF